VRVKVPVAVDCGLLPALLDIHCGAVPGCRSGQIKIADAVVGLRTPPYSALGVLEEIAHAIFREEERIERDFPRRGVGFGDGVHFHRRRAIEASTPIVAGFVSRAEEKAASALSGSFKRRLVLN
jgi:hypothetical protein